MSRPFYSAPVAIRPPPVFTPRTPRFHARFPAWQNDASSPRVEPNTFDAANAQTPWMTSQILDQIRRRNALKRTFDSSKQQSDWTEYDKCRRLVAQQIVDAKNRFCLAYPHLTDEIMQVPRRPFECRSCDQYFASQQTLDIHLSQHVRCQVPGCGFTASGALVEKHVVMQHETGLAGAIMSLNTPEAIAKWRDERRKNFATLANSERRQKQYEQRMVRGDRIGASDPSFRRNKATSSWQQQKSMHRAKPQPMFKIEQRYRNIAKRRQIVDESDDEEPSLCMFPGLECLKADASITQLTNACDSGVSSDNFSSSALECIRSVVADNKSNLASGCCEAAKEDFDNPSNYHTSSLPESKGYCANGVCEVDSIPTENPPGSHLPDAKCRTVLESRDEADERPADNAGNCGDNDENKDSKSAPSNKRNSGRRSFNRRNPSTKRSSNCPASSVSASRKRPRRLTLLEKLLLPDIRRERNLILQCIRHITKNNFFDDQPLISKKSSSLSADDDLSNAAPSFEFGNEANAPITDLSARYLCDHEVVASPDAPASLPTSSDSCISPNKCVPGEPSSCSESQHPGDMFQPVLDSAQRDHDPTEKSIENVKSLKGTDVQIASINANIVPDKNTVSSEVFTDKSGVFAQTFGGSNSLSILGSFYGSDSESANED